MLLCIFQSSGEPVTASGSPNETATFSSPSAASSGSSNETVTFSSPSAASSSSSNEIVTFSSPSAASSSSSNEIVTFSSPSAASSSSSNETAFTATSQDSEVAGRQATLQLKMQLSFPYDIPKGILQNILCLDSQTVLYGLGWDGWPSVYERKQEICALYGVSLSSTRPQPGQKTGDGGYLTTNAVAFQKITILVKHCPKCKALVQVFPYDLGKTWFEFCDINLLWFFQSSSYTIFKYCKHVPLLSNDPGKVDSNFFCYATTVLSHIGMFTENA